MSRAGKCGILIPIDSDIVAGINVACVIVIQFQFFAFDGCRRESTEDYFRHYLWKEHCLQYLSLGAIFTLVFTSLFDFSPGNFINQKLQKKMASKSCEQFVCHISDFAVLYALTLKFAKRALPFNPVRYALPWNYSDWMLLISRRADLPVYRNMPSVSCELSSSFACSAPRSSCLTPCPCLPSTGISCISSSPSISYLISRASISCLRCSSSNSTFCWKYKCASLPSRFSLSWLEAGALSFLRRRLRIK